MSVSASAKASAMRSSSSTGGGAAALLYHHVLGDQNKRNIRTTQFEQQSQLK